MLAIMPIDDHPLVPTADQPPARLAADVAAAEASPSALVEQLGLGQPSPAPRNKERENPAYAKAAKRFARAMARRAVEQQDPEALAELLALADYITQELAPAVVEGLRAEEGGAHSLTEIGMALGHPERSARAAVYDRFVKNAGRKAGNGARKGGAQPASRR